MRVNVYSEELTDEFSIIRKPEPGPEGRLFLGVRFFLKSAVGLHYTEKDDDRSAVTLWVPWNRKTQNEEGKQFMADLLHAASVKIRNFKDF